MLLVNTHPFPPYYKHTDIIFQRRYDRDLFCELLSIKEPQTTFQNKETIVQSYQKMSNQNTKKRPETEVVLFNSKEDKKMNNFGCWNSSLSLFYLCFVMNLWEKKYVVYTLEAELQLNFPLPYVSHYTFSGTDPPSQRAYFVDDPHLSQKVPKGNLFKIGVPHIINKFSLGSNLNLLESVANMLLSLKFMVQLHCNEWLDIAVFNIFEMFSLKIGDSHVFSCSSIKVVEDFSATYNLDNTCIMTNYSRANFFLK